LSFLGVPSAGRGPAPRGEPAEGTQRQRLGALEHPGDERIGVLAARSSPFG
jgi:hypothetical protein